MRQCLRGVAVQGEAGGDQVRGHHLGIRLAQAAQFGPHLPVKHGDVEAGGRLGPAVPLGSRAGTAGTLRPGAVAPGPVAATGARGPAVARRWTRVAGRPLAALAARVVPALAARAVPPVAARVVPALAARAVPPVAARAVPPVAALTVAAVVAWIAAAAAAGAAGAAIAAALTARVVVALAAPMVTGAAAVAA